MRVCDVAIHHSAVIPDQGIDRTTMRHSTFYDNTPNGPQGICHISLADPFHPRLRQVLIETAQELGIKTHPKGINVWPLLVALCVMRGSEYVFEVQAASSRMFMVFVRNGNLGSMGHCSD